MVGLPGMEQEKDLRLEELAHAYLKYKRAAKLVAAQKRDAEDVLIMYMLEKKIFIYEFDGQRLSAITNAKVKFEECDEDEEE